MPEAVIVATARSPIGRAVKGSLKDLRPDDRPPAIVPGASRDIGLDFAALQRQATAE